MAKIQTRLKDMIMNWDTPERSNCLRYQKVQREAEKFGKMGGRSSEWVSMAALAMTTQKDSIDENRVVFDTDSGPGGLWEGHLGLCGTRTIGVKMGTLV
jgi:hypothetical protein